MPRSQKLVLATAAALLIPRLSAAQFVPDPCMSTATAAAGVVVMCAQGDADEIAANNATITVTLRDNLGYPYAGVAASDIWVDGCTQMLALCGGRGISASGPTDANGMTTITGAIAAGGCDADGIRVVALFSVIGKGYGCNEPCIPIKVMSADIDGNLAVTLTDLAMFGVGYRSPPKPFDPCIAFYPPHDSVGLAAFARFATHYGHSCL